MSLSSFAQFPAVYSEASLAEKVYLHLDSKIYTTDETIWFNAIVVNAASHIPTQLSEVLYVELIGPEEKVIEKKVIKLENGIGSGFFQLITDYVEGLYLVRAYTQWDENFGKEFFFKEYVHVFAPKKGERIEPISPVTLVEGQSGERWIKASFDPFEIDSLHKKALTLVLSFDTKKDTIFIKRKEGNRYLLDYQVPDSCRFVTLEMVTKNHFYYTKTIALEKDELDLQFFPESGELVQGIPSLVGFKALDYNGKGRRVEGEIIDGKGKTITFFKSNQLGIGTFWLTSPDTATKYIARLLPQQEDRSGKIYPLPKVAAMGNLLSVKKEDDAIDLKVRSNYLENDSIILRASCRGLVYRNIQGILKSGTLEFSLPINAFPEGIIDFTMISHSQPVAERLYFNERPESRINIAVSTDSASYMQREPTTLHIETTDGFGKPVKACLSVAVINKAQMGEMQDTRQNILSYFLLSSDLKGTVEDPGYYFRKDEDRFNDLDALLLTQGWRKYNYTKLVYKLSFHPEPKLIVSGTVKEAISKQGKKEFRLTMMTFGSNPSVQEQTTDSLGRFYFDLNDQYGQNMNILIQSANKNGKIKESTIVLDKKQSPPVSFDKVKSIAGVDSVVNVLIERKIERKKVNDAFPLSKGTILLDEVTVQGYNMTPARKKMAEEYGKPDIVIEGKDIEEKEEKWSYGLFSVLFFNFRDKVHVGMEPDGTLYAVANNPDPTLFVIDGIPVPGDDYSLLSSIPPSEVKSFEVIEYAKHFYRLFLQVFPEVDPFLAPKEGNIIAIYTFEGKGLSYITRPVGILKTNVPVFSTSREFYEPKYKELKPEDWFKPDLRALVHWQPELVVDSIGGAYSTFYNADNIGNMEVVIEAISDKGEIGYKEIEYEVVKRNFQTNTN